MRTSRMLLVAAALIAAGVLVLRESLAQSGARPAAPTRVAACDIVEVFNNYRRAKDLTSRLEDKGKALTAENEQRVKAIEAIRLELEGLKPDSPEYEKRSNEMQRLSIERKTYIQFQEALAMREQHRLTKEMYDDIRKAIADTAREQGFQIVLYLERTEQPTENTVELLQQIERRKVLYCEESADVTTAVLARLNQTYTAN